MMRTLLLTFLLLTGLPSHADLRAAGAPGVTRILCKTFVAVSAPVDTTEDTLFTCTIPANALGPNGGVRIWSVWATTNGASTKTMRVKFGGTNYVAVATTTTDYYEKLSYIGNRNATNSQIGSQGVSVGLGLTAGGGTSAVTSAVDTTAAVPVLFTCQKVTSTDTCTLNGAVVEVLSDGT